MEMRLQWTENFLEKHVRRQIELLTLKMPHDVQLFLFGESIII